MGPPTSPPAVAAARLHAPAGGGPFHFGRLSVGIFLVDQPRHRIAVGSDKRVERPLEKHQGWILPPGASGLCEFDADHSFVAVEIADAPLRDAGLAGPADYAPRFGAHDPLMVQLALAASRRAKTLSGVDPAGPRGACGADPPARAGGGACD